MIERLARFGYVSKGLLYATIGGLAAAAAAGSGGDTTDTRGAMTTVLSAPFGRFLLAAMAIGLLGYAAWRLAQGIVDPEHRGNDAKALALRISFVLRGLVHAGLAYSAIRLATYHAPQSGGANAKADHWTARAFHLPGGEWLVWIAALSFAGFGAYQIYRAAADKLSEQLDTGAASADVGRWVVVVARFGIAARGLVFVAIGFLFARAAKQHDPSEAGGIAEALRSLEGLGRWPFAAIALGLVAYGGYQLINARYRRIEAP
jgi:hypothetical protein